ncbi:hypothetical protein FNV43_RR21406 [Rhamnella rubrinervis]|uniref:Uncharacterized protein n=1 Tax=Rhamnella rubrinervis TaxID=2594499 RepID=A0A8K0GRE7_9ROSA|nr:hypothetical protein FNV43_RR21406 [Rhamnella rubrinervis]
MAGETAPSINGIYYFATCPFTAFPNLLCELNHQDHGFGLRVLFRFPRCKFENFRQLLSGLDMYAIFLVLRGKNKMCFFVFESHDAVLRDKVCLLVGLEVLDEYMTIMF